jgi:hypothetical protein
LCNEGRLHAIRTPLGRLISRASLENEAAARGIRP